MAILQKLKSLLGFDDSSPERGQSREVGVTVERERSQEDRADTEPAADEGGDADRRAPASATSAAEEGATDADEPTAEADEAAEPVETDETAESETPDLEQAAEPDADEGEPDADADASEADESETDESEPAESDATEADEQGTDEPVTVIKGIGPAYGDRLADAGVETVADLAAADAAELESETDISATRIQGWIDRAAVR